MFFAFLIVGNWCCDYWKTVFGWRLQCEFLYRGLDSLPAGIPFTTNHLLNDYVDINLFFILSCSKLITISFPFVPNNAWQCCCWMGLSSFVAYLRSGHDAYGQQHCFQNIQEISPYLALHYFLLPHPQFHVVWHSGRQGFVWHKSQFLICSCHFVSLFR